METEKDSSQKLLNRIVSDSKSKNSSKEDAQFNAAFQVRALLDALKNPDQQIESSNNENADTALPTASSIVSP